MDNNFLVLKWENIEKKLSDTELEFFYDLLNKITEGEYESDEFYVFERSVIDKQQRIEIDNKEKHRLLKESVLKSLKELQELEDSEIAHLEADEFLLKYINDKDIEKAYDKINKYYS